MAEQLWLETSFESQQQHKYFLSLKKQSFFFY